MIRRRTLLVAVLVMGATTLTAQYPPLTASEVEAVEREARAVIQTYYQLFNEQNPKAMSEQLFHIPWIYLNPEGTRLFTSRQETAELFEESLAAMVPRGWERSDFPSPTVCVLSLGAATVSGNFHRYKKDGSVLSEHGVTYIVGKTAEGWRVVSLSSHPPNRTIGCRN
ncbi:MAG TPA: hypothetical protein VEK15_32600 [Vicinamibacteria bacterium]|nr:hypothetical protein [Vicinamibacteria bacterium]